MTSRLGSHMNANESPSSTTVCVPEGSPNTQSGTSTLLKSAKHCFAWGVLIPKSASACARSGTRLLGKLLIFGAAATRQSTSSADAGAADGPDAGTGEGAGGGPAGAAGAPGSGDFGGGGGGGFGGGGGRFGDRNRSGGRGGSHGGESRASGNGSTEVIEGAAAVSFEDTWENEARATFGDLGPTTSGAPAGERDRDQENPRRNPRRRR